MQEVEEIDGELRLLGAVPWSIRTQGVNPSTDRVDALLDERYRGRLLSTDVE
jgi:hypothetical protein